LPLNKRDYSQLVLLVPAQPTIPISGLAEYQRERKPHALQNDYLLDGIDQKLTRTSYREIASTSSFVSGPVQEFRVQSNGYSPNMATARARGERHHQERHQPVSRRRSGSSFRNDDLDAHGWTPTLGKCKAGGSIQPLRSQRRRTIVRDKTFFFVNYEGDREHDGVVFQATVPTVALTQGILGKPAAGLGATFGKVAPSSHDWHRFSERPDPGKPWSPVAQESSPILSFRRRTPRRRLRPRRFRQQTVINTIRADKFDIRIDHNVSTGGACSTL